MCDFFSVIERVFIRGIRRKNKKVKTVFASIPSRKYTFSKNKNVNSLKPQVQRLMKTVDFSREKKSLAMQKRFDSNPGIFVLFSVSI